MGKPVVATKTDAMSVFTNHTYQATNKEEFALAVEKALFENNPERVTLREVFARDHSWENNVKEIYRAIDVAMDNRKEFPGLPEPRNEHLINSLNYSSLKL
jgi:hypothetical protein